MLTDCKLVIKGDGVKNVPRKAQLRASLITFTLQILAFKKSKLIDIELGKEIEKTKPKL